VPPLFFWSKSRCASSSTAITPTRSPPKRVVDLRSVTPQVLHSRVSCMSLPLSGPRFTKPKLVSLAAQKNRGGNRLVIRKARFGPVC
jgi:hypothetical protein